MLKRLIALSAMLLLSIPSFADGIDSDAKLVLHMDGTDASTTFTDSSLTPKTVTAVNDAQIDTAQSVFGGASGLFPGSNDVVQAPDSTDWDFGTGDYTIDFRIRFNTVAGSHRCVFEIGTYATNGILFQRNTDGFLYYGQSSVVKSVAWTPSTATWYHIACVRQGQYTKIYVDGTSIATLDFVSTQDLNGGTNGLRIGVGWTGANNFDGWIDEFRVSKGIARWTTDFTPPTSAYSESSTRGRVIMISNARLVEEPVYA